MSHPFRKQSTANVVSDPSQKSRHRGWAFIIVGLTSLVLAIVFHKGS